LNPHNRNGHRILSPACLPFHHPGKKCIEVLLSCCLAFAAEAFFDIRSFSGGSSECWQSEEPNDEEMESANLK
jgi:hypothetical protein